MPGMFGRNRICWWWLLWLSVVVATHAFSDNDATCQRGGAWVAQELHASLSNAETHDARVMQPSQSENPLVQLLIGVKTSVVYGVDARRAIRETWGNRSALPVGVRIVFLGCEPNLSSFNSDQVAYIRDAIAREREQYDGDLLVEELASCRDAYNDLVNKVLAFFQWSASQTTRVDADDGPPTKTYVMVADDDIYLRINRLVELLADPKIPAQRFYGGQVWADQFHRPIDPVRDPRNGRHYLSPNQYPMEQLPPFANGPHYVLSTDVAHFIGQHRTIFRGVGGDPANLDSAGTFDDVSVALWTLAMQIRPRHFREMGDLRDMMCQNRFVSFADLTSEALYHIHDNLERGRSFCCGFSYATWLKQFIPTRTEKDVRDDIQRLEVWSTMEVFYRIVRENQASDISLTLYVNQKLAPFRKMERDYVPAVHSFYTFCETMAEHIATELNFFRGQPLFVCQQLRQVMLEGLRSILERSPTNRPNLALLVHNFGISIAAPIMKVILTVAARHAQVVIENLLTQAYAGMELLIFDEENYGTADRDPDIVVFTTAACTSDDQARAMMHEYLSKYTSRLLLVHPREMQVENRLDDRIVVVTSSPTKSPDVGQVSCSIYIPYASEAFASSVKHSPISLLRPYESQSLSSTTAPAILRLRQFCVDDYVPSQCDHPHRKYFFNLLNALDSVDVAGACPNHEAHHRRRNFTLAENLPRETAFALDKKVSRYEQFKFTIAFEDTPNAAGHISDTIVAAFLAGSIPIYYGHSATVTQVFNAKAFIDCGSFASLRVCAKHVLAVHASPSLYESMRREPPIVNLTVFFDVFSWHPDVVDLIQQRRSVGDMNHTRTLSERLKMLFDESP